ncbi:MAG: helix-turn-helix domain-containing protein, partial [Solobacterium sp.]|nr:helix-turn-helix domain-containing protein [Solobacterium sp.]
MEEFKVLLDQYMKRTGVDALAEACGISQRTLYRYIKGERLPDSIERVRKMADFFCLTPEERKRFTASFKAAYYGEEEYHNLTLVDRLLRNLNGLKEIPEADLSFSDKVLSLPADTIPLNDGETLMQTAKAIIFKEASNEKGKIRLHLDAESSFISEVLKPASTKGIRIEHVNPLHTASGSRNILEFLNDILPVVVNSENYSIYTYYEKEVSLSDERLSSLIITSEYAILANRYLTSGILFSSREMIEYCKDMFRTFKSASTEFFNTISSDTLNDSFFAQMASTAVTPTRDFHNGICMTPYLTEEMIRKYIRLERAKDVIPLLAFHVSNMKNYYSGQCSSGTEI